jgi:hypothetical protein
MNAPADPRQPGERAAHPGATLSDQLLDIFERFAVLRPAGATPKRSMELLLNEILACLERDPKY